MQEEVHLQGLIHFWFQKGDIFFFLLIFLSSHFFFFFHVLASYVLQHEWKPTIVLDLNLKSKVVGRFFSPGPLKLLLGEIPASAQMLL